MYLLGLLLMYALDYAHQPSLFSWGQGIQVLLLVQAWHALNHEIAGYWNPVAWTLSVEAFFYLCFMPLLTVFGRRRSRWLALLLSVTLAMAIFCKTPEMQLFQLQYRGRAANSLPFAVLRLPEFISGVLLGLLYNRKGSFGPRSLWTYIGLFGASLCLLLPLHGWNSIVLLPTSMLIYGLATQSTMLSNALSSTLMTRLGEASYAIYLLQLGVQSLVYRFILKCSPGLLFYTDRISFVVLILASLLIYQLWEEPLRYRIRATFMGPREKPA